MSCYMYPGVNFPQNVVELKIIYEGTDSSIDNFRMLGNQMIKQDSYHKLRKLEFKVDDFSPSIKDVQTKQRSRPYWAHFFNPFVEQGIQLKLTALGIEGEFRDDADDNTADILSEAIQLSELDTLDIVYCAYVRTHELESHEDGVHTFLDKITERLPGLRYLSVKHSRECHEYEINALRRILQENIANQLYQLRIVFENQSDEQLKRVRQAILHSQHYLVKLKVALESFWNNGDDREFIGIPALEDLVQEAINHKSKRDMLAPSIFDFDEIKPFIPEYLVRSIISYRRRILNALKADVIYKGAAQNLPYLTEYYFIGLYISIKEQSFFVNGRPILLDEKA
ncbi:hypothetical protein JCM33374_g3112 [Metschnikowia sp. JCM 33374]|nr:hypothetical protein JCM33374_g3112 [Metschnikowia sp. JCM 33374]